MNSLSKRISWVLLFICVFLGYAGAKKLLTSEKKKSDALQGFAFNVVVTGSGYGKEELAAKLTKEIVAHSGIVKKGRDFQLTIDVTYYKQGKLVPKDFTGVPDEIEIEATYRKTRCTFSTSMTAQDIKLHYDDGEVTVERYTRHLSYHLAHKVMSCPKIVAYLESQKQQ